MTALELMKERYSCRSFTGEPVSEEQLDLILQAALSAPTAVNKQPWRIWIIHSDEAMAKLREVTRYHFNAGTVLVLGADAVNGWVRPFDGKKFAEVDASIVGTQIMLEVQELGLGTTWVGYFDAEKLKAFFPQMKDYELIALFPLGYPAGGPSPRHAERFSREDMTEIL